VIAAFDEVPELRSSRLYIDVKSRVVTIMGRVRSESERQAAERTARSILGLRALVLELGIVPAPKVNVISKQRIADVTTPSQYGTNPL
jgi:osmotically-inducible protein OsmY